jgi:hypothetical protein
VACPHRLPKLPESTQRKQAIPNKGSLFYSHCGENGEGILAEGKWLRGKWLRGKWLRGKWLRGKWLRGKWRGEIVRYP